MEKKEVKKRFRPSLTAYRALESEVKELKEALESGKDGQMSAVVHGFKKVNESLQKDNKKLEDDCRVLRGKLSALESSNRHLSEEIARVREENDILTGKNNALRDENTRLVGRGFWSRVFNK